MISMRPAASLALAGEQRAKLHFRAEFLQRAQPWTRLEPQPRTHEPSRPSAQFGLRSSAVSFRWPVNASRAFDTYRLSRRM